MTTSDSYHPPLTTSFGLEYLAAGADVDRLLDSDLGSDWQLVLQTYRERRFLRYQLDRAAEDSEKATRLAAELAELAEVSALQALRADKRLLDELLARRQRLMIDARDEGASWADIGAVLEVSRQSAHELYHRKIRAL